MLERLQKILSARGICSRRKAEEYMAAGLVKVNGKVAKVGDKADASVDRIEVDGTVLKDRAEMLYYVMNKPEGVESTNLSGDRGSQRIQGMRRVQGSHSDSSKSSFSSISSITLSVRDLLPPPLQGKIFPVGRLDKDSSGLLIFTNDGVLAYRLTHPKFDHEKEYEVITDRPIDHLACKKLQEGFLMDGSMTKPLQCRKVATNRARVILTEGKNRQIRRMFQQVGYTVKELKRIRIMNFTDDKLPPGAVRVLRKEEKDGLLRSVGL